MFVFYNFDYNFNLLRKSRTRDLKQFLNSPCGYAGNPWEEIQNVRESFNGIWGVFVPLVHEELAYTLCRHARAASWEELVDLERNTKLDRKKYRVRGKTHL